MRERLFINEKEVIDKLVAQGKQIVYIPMVVMPDILEIYDEQVGYTCKQIGTRIITLDEAEKRFL